MAGSGVTFQFLDKCGAAGSRDIRRTVISYCGLFRDAGAQVVNILPTRSDPSTDQGQVLIAVEETPGKNAQGREFDPVRIKSILVNLAGQLPAGFRNLGIERFMVGDEIRPDWGERPVLALRICAEEVASAVERDDVVVPFRRRAPLGSPIVPQQQGRQKAATARLSSWVPPMNC